MSDDREKKAADGLAALQTFVIAVQGLGRDMQILAAQTNGLSQQVSALVTQVSKSNELQRSAIEHSRALQSQIGALVNAMAQQHGFQGLPAVPIPGLHVHHAAPPAPPGFPDPVGVIGRGLVNGFLDGVANRARSRRGPPL